MAAREEQMAWAREDRARMNAQRTAEDNAMRELQTMQRDGHVSSAGGLSDASTQMLYAGNGGYGKGDEAVQGAAGDFQREMARFKQAAPAPEGGLPMPKYDGTASVNKRAAKESEITGALMNLALAKRDTGAYGALRTQRHTEIGNELMAEAPALKPGTPEYKAFADSMAARYKGHNAVTLGKPGKDGFVQMSYDPMDGDAVFARMSPQQVITMARAERLMAHDPQRALQMMAGVDKDFAEAVARDAGIQLKMLDSTNNAAYHKGSLANQAERIANDDRHNKAVEGLRSREVKAHEAAAEAGKWKALGATDDGTGTFMISTMGETKIQPAGPGIDTRRLFPKQRERWSLNGDTFLDDSGRPVARRGESGEALPLSPAPRLPAGAADRLRAYGADTPVVVPTESGLQWGYRTPEGYSDDAGEAFRLWQDHEKTQKTVTRRAAIKARDYDTAAHEAAVRANEQYLRDRGTRKDHGLVGIRRPGEY